MYGKRKKNCFFTILTNLWLQSHDLEKFFYFNFLIFPNIVLSNRNPESAVNSVCLNPVVTKVHSFLGLLNQINDWITKHVDVCCGTFSLHHDWITVFLSKYPCVLASTGINISNISTTPAHLVWVCVCYWCAKSPSQFWSGVLEMCFIVIVNNLGTETQFDFSHHSQIKKIIFSRQTCRMYGFCTLLHVFRLCSKSEHDPMPALVLLWPALSA